jgi:thiol-disulfide isomerase/thioredoxin
VKGYREVELVQRISVSQWAKAGLVAIVVAAWPAYALLTESRLPEPAADPSAAVARLDYTLKDMNGKDVRLADFKGRPLVINFWATWCGPCIKEMPLLQKVYEKYKGKGLEIISISTDDATYKVGPFAARRKLIFPVFIDTGLKDRFAAQMIPVNVFIDREGRSRYRKVGYDEDSEREFEIILKKLLN